MTGEGRDQRNRLVEELESATGELEGVERRAEGAATVYFRNGRPFAAIEGTSASFLLQSEVAAAALRTPGTSRSRRGSDWVTLDLSSPDTFTADRAHAWLASAWRAAGRRPKTDA